MKSVLWPVFLLAGALLIKAQSAVTPQQLDEDIVRVRKELIAVQTERQQIKAEISKDRKEQQAYLERTRVRFQKLQSETDSVKGTILRKEKNRDSIAAVLTLAETRKKNYALRQEEFRKSLLGECDGWLVAARTLPPMSRRGFEGSLLFLRNDLLGTGVDNIEGLNRLLQISRDMCDVSATVQIVPEQQNVGGLRGSCPGIRVGTFFEAAIDEKGEKSVFWEGSSPDGTPLWKQEPDRQQATHIRKAIAVREGKSLPGFVNIPIAPLSVKETK